jgi:prophage regulatory protein
MLITYVSPKQAAAKFDISLATLWRWVKFNPEFPKPIRLSPGCTRFPDADLDAYAQSRSAGK